MALEDGVQALIDQASLEMAQSRFAKAAQDAGYPAVEVTDTPTFTAVLRDIATRTVADADANADVGDPLIKDRAPSWSEQARSAVAKLAAANDDSVTVDAVKQSLKDGLQYITEKADWDAATEWIAAELSRLVDAGVIRRTDPTTDSGAVEFIVTDMTEGTTPA